jgi:hypothetical protein
LRNARVFGRIPIQETCRAENFNTEECVSSRESLLEELARLRVKHTPSKVIAIARNAAGVIVFLEQGNARAGLEHILLQHGEDFARCGIGEAMIPAAILSAAIDGKQIGVQGTRPIYEVEFDGRTQLIAVTIADNGFVVGANPATR